MVGMVGHSSPWASVIVMEVALVCAIILDGYFRLKEGEGVRKAINATVIGMIIGIPLMALSILFAFAAIEYLENFVEHI